MNVIKYSLLMILVCSPYMRIKTDGPSANPYEKLFEDQGVVEMTWSRRLSFFKDLLADIDNFPDFYKVESLLFANTPLKQKGQMRAMVEAKINALTRSIQNKALYTIGVRSDPAEQIARFARERRMNQPIREGRTFFTEAIGCKIPHQDAKSCSKMFDENYDVVKLVSLLINNGADVNRRRLVFDENYLLISDFTPLMLAAQIGNADLVGILLIHGADARMKSQGLTALDIAVQHGAPKNVIKMLERAMS